MESPFELGNQVVIYGDFPYYRTDSLWVLESSKAPDPQHPEHEEMVDWVGGEFDPEAFDLDEVNRELQRLK
jgi:Plasmid pRiA4b ORF-3-like protein